MSRPSSRGATDRLSMLSAIGFETNFEDDEVQLMGSSGEPDFGGIYGSSKEDVFDSDQTFQHAAPHVNGDVVINSAEKFLRLVVSDRKILLESEVDILPPSFRLELSAGNHYATSTQQTRDLVDSLISGASLQTSQDAEADHDNFLSGVYINDFFQVSKDVCGLSESLLDAYQSKPTLV